MAYTMRANASVKAIAAKQQELQREARKYGSFRYLRIGADGYVCWGCTPSGLAAWGSNKADVDRSLYGQIEARA